MRLKRDGKVLWSSIIKNLKAFGDYKDLMDGY